MRDLTDNLKGLADVIREAAGYAHAAKNLAIGSPEYMARVEIGTVVSLTAIATGLYLLTTAANDMNIRAEIVREIIDKKGETDGAK